jgi:hypothetical protein
MVQTGWPLGVPLVCNLGKGLWEMRIYITEYHSKGSLH